MRKAIMLTALVLMFLLSTTSAFAMVDGEKPPDGMMGITSVDEGTSPDNPSGLPVDQELVNRADVLPEGEYGDSNIATTDIAEDSDMVLTAPIEDGAGVTSDNPDAIMEFTTDNGETQIFATGVNDSTKNNAIPVTTYYLASAGLLAAIISFVALKRRFTRQGA